MTLPASPNAISFANINTETAKGTGYSSSISWVKSITKAANQSNALGGYRGLAYYKKTNAGNCNNGNCNCTGNCGDIQCVNCYASQCVNCVNCDAGNYIQANCNCACTYNCNSNAASYNCNCDCACACGG